MSVILSTFRSLPTVIDLDDKTETYFRKYIRNADGFIWCNYDGKAERFFTCDLVQIMNPDYTDKSWFLPGDKAEPRVYLTNKGQIFCSVVLLPGYKSATNLVEQNLHYYIRMCEHT